MERSSDIYGDDDSVIGSESDIYDTDGSESERESDIYRDVSESTLGFRASTGSNAMGPPRIIPPEEMILLRKYRQCKEDIQSLRYAMSEKNAQIDVLKIIRERLEKEVSALNINNEVLKQRVADLTKELPNQGGTRKNKRIKHVSKYSTSSKNHASRRYSSKR